MAIYLRALQVRLERLQNKPQRDEDLTKQVAPFAAQLPDLSRPARWLLEEWRVALFAQELKRSEEHTSELQSLMRISYAVFCLKNKKYTPHKSSIPTTAHSILITQHTQK